MPIGSHRFNVGELGCIVVQDSARDRNAKDLFKSTPGDELTQAAQALDFKIDAIPVPCLTFVVHMDDRWVLVDSGNAQTDEDNDSGNTLHILRQEGIDPEDIDTLVITHCHGDHIAGLTDEDGNPNYPNARYFMWKAEWDYWLAEDTLTRLGENTKVFFEGTLTPIKDKITLLETETEIAPGISVVPMPGHTPGHAGVRLESSGERLLHIADAAHISFQPAHPDWEIVFDTDPKAAINTRRALFRLAARDNLLVMAYHFPFPGLGHVIPDGDVWKWRPLL